MDYKCCYCKDGITWCFGPNPSPNSGLVSLCCSKCVAKLEALNWDERKAAVQEITVAKILEAMDAIMDASTIAGFEESIAYDAELSNKMGAVYATFMEMYIAARDKIPKTPTG